MVDGRALKFLVLSVLLLAPTVFAAAPRATFQAAYGLDGQDISDFALDPMTGTYAIAVPVFTSPKLPLLGQSTPRDVYLCEFDGTGCRPQTHDTATGQNGARQVADAVAFNTPSGLTARYAVGGPARYVSMWSNLQESPRWTKQTLEGDVVAVAVEPNEAKYVVVASSSALSSTGNRISVFDGGSGRFLWDYNVTDASGATSDVRPTSLDYSRSGGIVVVGTTKGVLFLKPADGKPTTYTQTSPINTGSVTDVAMSRLGTAALARTTTGIDYLPIENGKPRSEFRWNRGLPSAPAAIALSGDGERFAAAAGNKVYFYRHLNNSYVAEDVGQAYDVGAAVSSLAYDETGSLLVATAGNRVFAFGASEREPFWNFDATQSVNGGLDGPLRGAAVSDDGSRVMIAGKTKLMPYRTFAAAEIAPVGPATVPLQPGASTTVSFNVANVGSLPDNYTFVVTRPVGWGGSTPEAFGLVPDKTRTINISVDAPPGIPPGPQAIKVEVRSRALASIVSTASINFTVPRAVSLAVEIQGERVEVSAGEERSIPLTVRNLGNAEGLVNLTATQSVTTGPSWNVRFNPQQVRVGANGEATSELIVTAPSDIVSGARNLLTVQATEGAVQATDSVSIFIDPEFTVDVATGATRIELPPGESRTFTFNVTNRGNTDDSYNLTANVTPLTQASDWTVRLSEEQIAIPHGQNRQVTVTVRAAVAEPREDAVLVLKAVSVGTPTVQDTANVPLVPKPREEEKDNGLPAPGLAYALAVVAAAAFARRLRRDAK